MQKVYRLSLMCVWLCLAVSCRSGQRAAPIDVPSSAMQLAAEEASSDQLFSVDESLPPNWWSLFGDAQLTGFVETALIKSPNLQATRAKIMRAAANADSMRAALYPNIFWGADVLRQKLSKTGLTSAFTQTAATPPSGSPPSATQLPVAGGLAGLPVYYSQYETEFTLNFDFDIWGKNKNMFRAAMGQLRANMADDAFSRLQLGISVAKVYYQLQVFYQRAAVAKALVDNQNMQLNLNRQRVQQNLDTHQTIFRSQANLTNFKKSLLQLQGQITVAEYQLKTLLAGNFDEEICNIQISEQALPKVPLPQNLPLHLIAHRPDITAQLWLIQSAGKQIKAAQAGFYPDFNIVALIGLQSLRLDKLFEGRSSYFSVDPALTLPVFDGGKLIANLHNSEVNYDLAILQYNQLVLNAVGEVLTDIAVLRNAEQQRLVLKENLEYQANLVELAKLRIAHHVGSEFDFLVNEATLLQVQDLELEALGDTLQAILSLIQALGGGYDTCYGET